MGLYIRNGHVYNIIANDGETPEKTSERGWFICKIQPKTHAEYMEAVKLSNIYSNIKYFKCKYSKKIMEHIREIEQI